MFDLDAATEQWRRQMLAAGVKTPVPLEELESHLRDEFERQMKSGLSGEEAFEIAVGRIGPACKLGQEFRKMEFEAVKPRITIGLAIVAMLLGTAMILPALGKHKQRHQAALARGAGFVPTEWAQDEVYGLTWGTTLAVVGLGTGVYGFRRRWAQAR